MQLPPYKHFKKIKGVQGGDFWTSPPSASNCETQDRQYDKFYTILLDLAKNGVIDPHIRTLSSVGLFKLGDNHSIAVPRGKTNETDNWEVVPSGGDNYCQNGWNQLSSCSVSDKCSKYDQMSIVSENVGNDEHANPIVVDTPLINKFLLYTNHLTGDIEGYPKIGPYDGETIIYSGSNYSEILHKPRGMKIKNMRIMALGGNVGTQDWESFDSEVGAMVGGSHFPSVILQLRTINSYYHPGTEEYRGLPSYYPEIHYEWKNKKPGSINVGELLPGLVEDSGHHGDDAVAPTVPVPTWDPAHPDKPPPPQHMPVKPQIDSMKPYINKLYHINVTADQLETANNLGAVRMLDGNYLPRLKESSIDPGAESASTTISNLLKGGSGVERINMHDLFEIHHNILKSMIPDSYPSTCNANSHVYLFDAKQRDETKWVKEDLRR
jgi:hypothetical protein